MFISILLIVSMFLPGIHSIRCYQCEYRRCPTLSNCREVRDICTINNFQRWDVRQIECPGPCETHLVTDPNGKVIKWHRGCSTQPMPTRGSSVNICETIYRVGIKEDICTCSGDLCNSSTNLQLQLTVISLITISRFLLLT
ncbi:uncharacterized protein LOC128391312 [Panonychus citri]|uniref:uncharacterized protein LOC128391312 n=1 Tax=Panonychus citri TaxID=50023 RepID=UPI0023076B92|nr:uncharacterized protein LOC128391312 [Panonychus citri]